MADNLDVNTYEQIVEALTRIANNYSNMAGTFYDVFYNPEEKNVTFQMIDESGIPQTYTVENLSLSNRYRKNGTVYPEGTIEASKGTMYQDRSDGEAYIKKIDGGNEGWFQLINKATLDGLIQQGNVDPNEGPVEAKEGTLYINTETSDLYIRLKSTSYGRPWGLINASIDRLANNDLSNVTTIEGSGVTAVGNVAESVVNSMKTETVNRSSTHNKIPTAKAVYEFGNSIDVKTTDSLSSITAAIEELENIKQDKSNIENGTLTNSTSKYPSSALMYSLLGDVETLINSL